MIKTIQCDADVSRGLAELQRLDSRLILIADRTGTLPLRLSAPNFEGLAEIIVSQHVSKASAAAVFGRLQNKVSPFTAEAFLDAGSKPLVDAGLTRNKQQALISVAQLISDGDLDLRQVCQMPATDAQAELTRIRGIGTWTAEVFLLFCAGHVDIFPAGDVALRHAVAVGLELPSRPTEKQVRQIAERHWLPWRGIAARLFWAYYARICMR